MSEITRLTLVASGSTVSRFADTLTAVLRAHFLDRSTRVAIAIIALRIVEESVFAAFASSASEVVVALTLARFEVAFIGQ